MKLNVRVSVATSKTRGLIYPDEFIPLAEQTGLIAPLTAFVLEKAMQQSVEWQQKKLNITMAVNLSMHNIQDEQFPALLCQLIDQYDIGNGHLILELTESTIMNNPKYVTLVLEEIASMGIKLSIDDFGTGYSSLSSLKKMPVHELKIDRSFVTDMANNAGDNAIVQSIIQMAHTMGLKVVAEGVETREVAEQLKNLNCDILQGYYFSKPLPIELISEIIIESNWNTNININTLPRQASS